MSNMGEQKKQGLNITYPVYSTLGRGVVGDVVEYERVKAWHATFNAALTGYVMAGMSVSAAEWARVLTDEVHGSIKIDP